MFSVAEKVAEDRLAGCEVSVDDLTPGARLVGLGNGFGAVTYRGQARNELTGDTNVMFVDDRTGATYHHDRYSFERQFAAPKAA